MNKNHELKRVISLTVLWIIYQWLARAPVFFWDNGIRPFHGLLSIIYVPLNLIGRCCTAKLTAQLSFVHLWSFTAVYVILAGILCTTLQRAFRIDPYGGGSHLIILRVSRPIALHSDNYCEVQLSRDQCPPRPAGYHVLPKMYTIKLFFAYVCVLCVDAIPQQALFHNCVSVQFLICKINC